MPLKSYRELRVWRTAMALVKDLYRLTAAFPELERYGLTAQLRRGGVSVPSNIAEGYSRTSRREYLRFLGMARSAIAEIETQLMLARDLDMAAEAEILTVLAGFESLGRMLTRLASSLAVRSPSPKPQPPDPSPEQYAAATRRRTAPSHPAQRPSPRA